MRVTVTLLAFVIVLSSVGTAFQNEPEGFRGLKWGDAPTEDMTFQVDINQMMYYVRSEEKMVIGDVPLEVVSYGFYEDRFAVCIVLFTGQENYNLLRTILEARHGAPSEEGFYKTAWQSQNAVVSVEYKFGGQGVLSITIFPIAMEIIRAKEKEAVDKAADDF